MAEPSDPEYAWSYSGTHGNMQEAAEATGFPRFLSTPSCSFDGKRVTMRIGGQRPLKITVSGRNGTYRRELIYDRPGSVIHCINHQPGVYTVQLTGPNFASVKGSFQVPQRY